MNYTKIKTFKGLDYGRSESTQNFIDKIFSITPFTTNPNVPTTNLTQDLESTSGFSRVPLSGVNRISVGAITHSADAIDLKIEI